MYFYSFILAESYKKCNVIISVIISDGKTLFLVKQERNYSDD